MRLGRGLWQSRGTRSRRVISEAVSTFSCVALDTFLPSLSLRMPFEGLIDMCRVWELVMELGGLQWWGWDRVRVRPLPMWPGLELLSFFSQGWPCSPRALRGLLTAGSSVTTTTTWTGMVAARPVWHVQEVRAMSLLLGPLPESRDGLGGRGQESGGWSPELGLGCSVLRSLVHLTGTFWAIGFQWLPLMIMGFDSRDPLPESFHSLTLSCKEAFVNQLPVSSLSHYFLYLSYDTWIEIVPILQKRELRLGEVRGLPGPQALADGRARIWT